MPQSIGGTSRSLPPGTMRRDADPAVPPMTPAGVGTEEGRDSGLGDLGERGQDADTSPRP